MEALNVWLPSTCLRAWLTQIPFPQPPTPDPRPCPTLLPHAPCPAFPPGSLSSLTSTLNPCPGSCSVLTTRTDSPACPALAPSSPVCPRSTLPPPRLPVRRARAVPPRGSALCCPHGVNCLPSCYGTRPPAACTDIGYCLTYYCDYIIYWYVYCLTVMNGEMSWLITERAGA